MAESADTTLAFEWISNLLTALDHHDLAEETRSAIVRECAIAHYRSANMEEIVSRYKGDIEAFLQFLSREWKWKITYDRDAQIITADEDKRICVCPLVQKSIGKVSATLCHCSEGFAERMFSAVVEKPVKAEVTKSILRGDKSCVYTIQIL
jgi:predicted hydrocarbon binding protein